MNGHPIRLVVTDDLQRSRLTVFFRWILVIPHAIVLVLWGVLAYLAVLANWFATLFTGQSPAGLHTFIAKFLRYHAQVSAYQYLLADPFPSFGGGAGYPIDLEIDPPQPQSRLTVFFRALLAIPAFLLAYVLNAVLQIIAFLGWFVCLFTGRMPAGMRNLGAYCLRYNEQTLGYYFLLTGRYPSLSSEGSMLMGATPTPSAGGMQPV